MLIDLKSLVNSGNIPLSHSRFCPPASTITNPIASCNEASTNVFQKINFFWGACTAIRYESSS